MTTRDEYANKMKAEFDDVSSQIDQWLAKAKEARGDAGERYEKEIAQLRQQSTTASEQLTELRAVVAGSRSTASRSCAGLPS